MATFQYNINNQDKTATLGLFLGDIYVTQYTYHNGFVTLSARPAQDVGSIAEIQENVNLIGRWINNIQSSLSPTKNV